MENTVVLLIRNLVMLACLFVVPLLALLGPSVTGFRSPRLLAAAATPGTDSAKPERAENERPRGTGEPMGVPNLSAAMFAPVAPGAAIAAPRPRDRLPPSIAKTSQAERPQVQAAMAHLAPEYADRVQPARYSPAQIPAPREVPTPSDRTNAANSAPWPPAPQASGSHRSERDYLEVLTTRLRELGASYYLLECWGQQPKVYRFYCQMGESGARATSFEAVAPDQVSTVERVLDQAEAWSAARQQPQMAERPRGVVR